MMALTYPTKANDFINYIVPSSYTCNSTIKKIKL